MDHFIHSFLYYGNEQIFELQEHISSVIVYLRSIWDPENSITLFISNIRQQSLYFHLPLIIKKIKNFYLQLFF